MGYFVTWCQSEPPTLLPPLLPHCAARKRTGQISDLRFRLRFFRLRSFVGEIFRFGISVSELIKTRKLIHHGLKSLSVSYKGQKIQSRNKSLSSHPHLGAGDNTECDLTTSDIYSKDDLTLPCIFCYCLQSQLVTTWWFLFPSRLMENWGKKMRLKFPSWRHVTSREVLCSPLRPLGQSYNATCQVPLNTTHTLHTIREENTFLTNQFSDIDVHMDEWWWTF